MDSSEGRNRLRDFIFIHLDGYNTTGGMSLFANHVWPAWRAIIIKDVFAEKAIPVSWKSKSTELKDFFDALFVLQFPERAAIDVQYSVLLKEEIGTGRDWDSNNLLKTLAQVESEIGVENKFCPVLPNKLSECLDNMGITEISGLSKEDFIFSIKNSLGL